MEVQKKSIQITFTTGAAGFGTEGSLALPSINSFTL